MKDVYKMTDWEFIEVLEKVTTPEEIFDKAAKGAEFYDVLTGLVGQDCSDTVLREWAFDWSVTKLGKDYNEIYNRWMEG